ncbi:MAG: Gfo/Idh/MocA family oxidoreductase [Spirochaetales bacterium]|nr:Gfo/Idh/MocA family oxidoreductase [Spirochaetales bacterium]
MLKVGLIGVGYIGPIHLDALSRIGGVKVKTIIDVNKKLAEKAALDFNVENYGTDYRDVINDSEIDVIHNCTPNKYHFSITKEILNAGKSVLSEKPLAITLKEAEKLVDIAEKKGAVTGIDFCYRYYPVVQEMAARIKHGDAGAVRMVTGSYFQDWLSLKTDWSWRLLRSESGESNITADLGSHWFDLLQFVTGHSVKEVFGDLATIIPVREKPKKQVLAFEKVDKAESEKIKVELEEYASILFHLDNGAPGSFTTSQVCSGRKSDTEIQVYGSKCSYAWNHKESNKLWIGYREKPNETLIENPTIQSPITAKYATLPAGHPLGYRDAVLNLFRDYYSAVEGAEPDIERPTFLTGYEEMRILKAILESYNAKRWVRVGD